MKLGCCINMLADNQEPVGMKYIPYLQEYGYDYGHDLYNDKKYEEAIPYLLAAYRMGGTDADTLYFLGRSYQRNGDEENAREYFQLLVRQYPDSERADMAHQCMDGLE